MRFGLKFVFWDQNMQLHNIIENHPVVVQDTRRLRPSDYYVDISCCKIGPFGAQICDLVKF